MLDKDYNLKEKLEDTLEDKRANYLVATTGDKQDEKYILVPHSELEEKLTGDLKTTYEEYNERVKLNNSFFQTFRVEPEKILNTETNQMEENPKAKNNVFKFFYRPFRQREYTVNYIDERFKGKETEKGAAIIDPELVVNGNRHYDARNYRPIPGWVLAEGEKPQQQLFFDVDEDTNAFLGINGTGKKEITFYYKDVRVIEVPKDGKTPEGYVRVTFKADKGGSFTDKDGKSVTELHYDVIKGLKSDLLPVPKELEEGKEKADGKYYVTPDDGKKFVKWDEQPLLNKNTIINENHTFTAYFEWSGLSAKGLVTTESFKEDNGQWINNFAPTIDQLKKQLVWKEKDVEKPLPADATVKIVDETGKELTDQDVYNLVNEKKAFDKDELVRTVNFKAVVNFKDGKNEEKLDIPVKIYKNVYEALTGTDKPKFLSDAEKGELKDITGDYVKVTVNPTGKPGEKDSKVYYVNPKAWVNIPEIILTEEEKANLGFTNWTADQAKQNENKEANGIYDFTKRHKFTDKETVISPGFSKDVVEQKQGEDKPKVPDNYVKVIVKTTDKATSELTETFWVNPTKEVTLPVADPTGKADQEVDIPKLGKKKVTYVFKEWQKVQTGEAEDKLTEVKPAEKIDLAKNQYTTKVTIVEAAYNERFAATPIVKPIKTDELHTPEGKEITNDDLIKQITPQKGKEIESITVVERPDPSKPGKTEAKVTIKYKDGSSQGTDKDPVIIPVEVHKNIIPEAPGGQRPKDAMDNYVKVIFKAGTGGSLSGNLVYYVSPEVEVNMTESADKITKTPSTGYISGDWDTSETKKLKAKFTANETEFIFNFTKSEDIVEKIDENTKKPDGYVEVIFKTEDENKGKIEGNVAEKIYYVNPTAEIKLVKLAEGQTAGEKQLTVPKTLPAKNYVFDKWYEDIDTTNSITSERIHVAKFLAGQVSLTYKAGEGATGQVPEKVTVNYGTSVSLARPEGLSKANATFAGWKLDGEDKIYQPGDQVKLEKARTATAQWTTAKHTVTFNSMGGSDVPKQVVDHEKTATNPEAPKLDGKVFMGWKENASDENYFDFTTQIIEDKTLMAIWQAPVQKINNTDTVEEQFIKVTFQEGEHGQLVPDKDKQDEKVATVTYKVAKDYDFDKAVKAGLVVPEIVPAKYYKAKTDNQGWNTELKLEGANAVFTAQYEPIADVIPVDPQVTDETQIENEKPEGMVLVTFTVDENKAFMVGDTKFYVKANTKVDIPTPVVHPMTFENDEPNDYEFKGWSYDKDEDGEYNFIFTKDTNIDDGQLVKPIISIRYPRSNATIVYVSEITDRATGYIEIIRGSGSPVLIEAVNNDDGDIVFKVPAQLGGKLKRRDIIRAYSKLDNIQSDIREYRVR